MKKKLAAAFVFLATMVMPVVAEAAGRMPKRWGLPHS